MLWQTIVIVAHKKGLWMAGKTTHFEKNNCYLLLILVEVPSCCWVLWVVQGLGPLLKLRIRLIQPSINGFFRIMSKHQSRSWSYTGVGSSYKTMTQKTVWNLQRHSCRQRITMFWSGLHTRLICISLKTYGMIWNRLDMFCNHQI